MGTCVAFICILCSFTSIPFEEELYPNTFSNFEKWIFKFRLRVRTQKRQTDWWINRGAYEWIGNDHKKIDGTNIIIIIHKLIRTREGNSRSFFKKIVQSRPLFNYFRPFLITISIVQIGKSIDGVLGTQTCSRMMVGIDDTTELWRPPKSQELFSDFYIGFLSASFL